MLDEVNASTGGDWRLDARFTHGQLGGAWRIRSGVDVAVLKWHDPASDARYNPDAPAVAGFLRSAGYPTPARLASGRTRAGLPWAITELVDGEPLTALDVTSAELFVGGRRQPFRSPNASTPV